MAPNLSESKLCLIQRTVNGGLKVDIHSGTQTVYKYREAFRIYNIIMYFEEWDSNSRHYNASNTHSNKSIRTLEITGLRAGHETQELYKNNN